MKRNSLVSETMSFVRVQATPLPKQGMIDHPIEVTFGTGTISASVQRHLIKVGPQNCGGTVVLMGSSILPAVVRHIASLR